MGVGNTLECNMRRLTSKCKSARTQQESPWLFVIGFLAQRLTLRFSAARLSGIFQTPTGITRRKTPICSLSSSCLACQLVDFSFWCVAQVPEEAKRGKMICLRLALSALVTL